MKNHHEHKKGAIMVLKQLTTTGEQLVKTERGDLNLVVLNFRDMYNQYTNDEWREYQIGFISKKDGETYYLSTQYVKEDNLAKMIKKHSHCATK